jgi:UPF0755 protein
MTPRDPYDDDPFADDDYYGTADPNPLEPGYFEPGDPDFEAASAAWFDEPAAAPGPRRGPAHSSRTRGVDYGRGGGGGRRGLRIVVGVIAVLLLGLGAVGVWAKGKIDPGGAPGEVQAIEIPLGSTSSQIGQLLEDADVISSSFVWDWYLRIKGGGPFEAGRYELATNSAMSDVIDTLSDGPAPPDERAFTIPEGFTLSETLDRLADPEKGLGFDRTELQQIMDSGQVRSEFQPADQPSNEGILLPETYRVEPDATALEVLTMLVEELDATLRGLDLVTAEEQYNLTPYDILIIASLIEEETKVPAEREKVARVIYNRLKQGIPLGIDATSRYEAEVIRGDRNKIDFTSSSPYNTRKVKGLPPTPIASPGRASIEAALNPAEGPWIYYVLADANGTHFFTESNSEFLQAKARCKDAGLGCG